MPLWKHLARGICVHMCVAHLCYVVPDQSRTNAVLLAAGIVAPLLVPYYTILLHRRKAGRCVSAASQSEVLSREGITWGT